MTTAAKSAAARFAVITGGCALYALAFCWFYAPARLSMGGFTGLAQVICIFAPSLPVGLLVAALNLPLFFLIWKKTGRDWLIGSLYATAVSSLFIDLLPRLVSFQALDPFLAAIYGGITVGVACGLMLRQSATVGGTELAARLLRLRMQQLSIGTLCSLMDGAIVLAYAAAFRNISQALYAILSLIIISFVMDRVVYGSTARVACIISERYEELAAQLLSADRGITLLDGEGGFHRRCTKVILCAADKNQLPAIKRLVQQTDPQAFVIVYDAHEILGRGFRSYQTGGV